MCSWSIYDITSCNDCTIASCKISNNASILSLVAKCNYWRWNSFFVLVIVVEFIVLIVIDFVKNLSDELFKLLQRLPPWRLQRNYCARRYVEKVEEKYWENRTKIYIGWCAV